MSHTIFLIIALVTTGIFLIQFVLSIFFGDIDADVDVDADISSVVSFKGLTHFGIGFGWYMYLVGNADIASYAIGILVGLFFVFAVWFLYKKAYQLQQVNRSEETDQLVGRECTIYFKQSDNKYTVQTNRDGAMREVDVISETGKHIRPETEQSSAATKTELYTLNNYSNTQFYDTRNANYGCYTSGGHSAYFYRYPVALP